MLPTPSSIYLQSLIHLITTSLLLCLCEIKSCNFLKVNSEKTGSSKMAARWFLWHYKSTFCRRLKRKMMCWSVKTVVWLYGQTWWNWGKTTALRSETQTSLANPPHMPLCASGSLWNLRPPFSSQTKPALVHLLDQWGKVVGQIHVSTLGPAGILEIGFHCHCSLLPSQAVCTLEWKAEVCSINLFLSKKFRFHSSTLGW